MKIATFTIQNLFHRDKTLHFKSLHKSIRDWTTELDQLMRGLDKKTNDHDRIRELSFLLGFERNTTQNFGVLRRRNGELYLKQGELSHEPKASELTHWNGWMPIHTVPISKKAVQHKARMIAEMDPDILLLQEVEDRASLMAFQDDFLIAYDILPYEQLQVLEGNDPRGVGFGILTKKGYRLEGIKSYGHLQDGQGNPLFDRDCQEYWILTPHDTLLTILSVQFAPNHPEKRKKQASALAKIYDGLLCQGREHILICGTLYEPYFSEALQPLFTTTDLQDISKHKTFAVSLDLEQGASYHSLGAYKKGVNLRQKDYFLYPQHMANRITCAGMDRRGLWPSHRSKWPVYPTLKQRHDAASAHPFLWLDLREEL